MLSIKQIVTGFCMCLGATAMAAQPYVVKPNETIKIYKNGHLVEQLHNHSKKPMIIHFAQKNGQQPSQETIQIQEKSPQGQSHEVIRFVNDDTLNNDKMFNDIVRDQRHEEVMMQQYLHHMNRYMNAEIDQVNRDEPDMVHNITVDPSNHRLLHQAFKERLEAREAKLPKQDQSWWGLIKSYF